MDHHGGVPKRLKGSVLKTDSGFTPGQSSNLCASAAKEEKPGLPGFFALPAGLSGLVSQGGGKKSASAAGWTFAGEGYWGDNYSYDTGTTTYTLSSTVGSLGTTVVEEAGACPPGIAE